MNLSKFNLIYFELISLLKIYKCIYLYILYADMASDMSQMKKCAATWQCAYTCVRARLCVHLCVHVCARVRKCEERDKLPFQDNAITPKITYLIYALTFLNFCHVGLCFVLNARMTWHHKERSTRALKIDPGSSLMSRGMQCNSIHW